LCCHRRAQASCEGTNGHPRLAKIKAAFAAKPAPAAIDLTSSSQKPIHLADSTGSRKHSVPSRPLLAREDDVFFIPSVGLPAMGAVEALALYLGRRPELFFNSLTSRAQFRGRRASDQNAFDDRSVLFGGGYHKFLSKPISCSRFIDVPGRVSSSNSLPIVSRMKRDSIACFTRITTARCADQGFFYELSESLFNFHSDRAWSMSGASRR